MKLALLTAIAAAILPVTAFPAANGPHYNSGPKPGSKPDFSLVGFGKDNPIGPTTGGAGGETVRVNTAAELIAAVADDKPRIVKVSGGTYNLTGRLKVGSNKSLIGTGSKTWITGAGINIFNVANVVVRNLGIKFILDNDGITIQNSTRVWIDHNEFYSDLLGGPDKYDGQCDIVRASDWITVSWNYFHDHWKSSLVGNSDALRDVDFGHLHITYQCVSSLPSPSSRA